MQSNFRLLDFLLSLLLKCRQDVFRLVETSLYIGVGQGIYEITCGIIKSSLDLLTDRVVADINRALFGAGY